MEQIKTIFLAKIPKAIEQALVEQLTAFDGIKIILDGETPHSAQTSTDLIITHDQYNGDFSQTPVFKISSTKKYRLGNLLQEIVKMLKEPNLYLDEINLGTYKLLPQKKMLIYKDGGEINLTAREVDIISYLHKNKNQAINREQLLKNVWQYHEDADTHTLETHIYRLRQKIEKATGQSELILTGEKGYLLNTSDQKV